MSGHDQDFQASLRETARDLLTRRAGSDVVRRIADDGDEAAGRALWSTIAELGWTGIEVPDEHGGTGAAFADLAVLLHEMGRALTPLPFATATALGVGALLAGNDRQRADWLPRLAAGEAVVSAALTGPDGVPDAPGVRVVPGGAAVRLDGSIGFVPDLEIADAVAVAARDDGGTSLFLVDLHAGGVVVEPQRTVDHTRRVARLTLTGTDVSDADAIGPRGEAAGVVDELLDRAAIAVAADCLGGAERVLETTVAYLKERRQFGRPVGSFQALKHRCADLFLAVEAARAAVEHAASAIDDAGQRAAAASIAKSYAGDAYAHVAAEGIQLHGGIGYTWEHDLHMHLKRAKLGQALFGDSPWHRERLAALALADA